jgi:hypothetical protein
MRLSLIGSFGMWPRLRSWQSLMGCPPGLLIGRRAGVLIRVLSFWLRTFSNVAWVDLLSWIFSVKSLTRWVQKAACGSLGV